MLKLEQIALIVYVCASTAGVLIIKSFLNTIRYNTATELITQLINLNLILGVFLYVAGFVTWLYVLSKMDLNIAYPIAITLSFIAIVLSSALFLHEKITANIAIGTAVCLIGIIIILR